MFFKEYPRFDCIIFAMIHFLVWVWTKCSTDNKRPERNINSSLSPSTVYQGDVKTTNGDIYPYIGISHPPFKTRWYDHGKDFRNEEYRNCTELSKLVWRLKDNNIQHRIDWKIITKCHSYQAGSRSCDLCLTEKLNILKNPKCINKKTEIISKCRHRRKFLIQFYT